MLIVKVYVNSRQIDELQIQNIENLGNGQYVYAIRKPEGFSETIIKHRRADGWIPLVRKVLNAISK